MLRDNLTLPRFLGPAHHSTYISVLRLEGIRDDVLGSFASRGQIGGEP